MKRIVLLTIGLISFTAGLASAQTATRTITNFDLEKYKAQRVSAEKDLRENYEQLGFPSPEVMAERRRQADLERSALSAKLEFERLERERIALEQQYLQTQNSVDLYVVQNSNGGSYPYYFGNSYYRAPRYTRYVPRRYFQSNGITVGGGYFYPGANPNQGIQINTTGPVNPPVRIRTPRP